VSRDTLKLKYAEVESLLDSLHDRLGGRSPGILLIIGIDAVRLTTVVVVIIVKVYLLYRMEHGLHERTKERILQEVMEPDDSECFVVLFSNPRRQQ
jgi:hypothetical protein